MDFRRRKEELSRVTRRRYKKRLTSEWRGKIQRNIKDKMELRRLWKRLDFRRTKADNTEKGLTCGSGRQKLEDKMEVEDKSWSDGIKKLWKKMDFRRMKDEIKCT